jgi:hypothetical protein
MMQRREIDWSTATVSDGELSVDLTGESSKRWSARAETVLTQLQHAGGGWDEAAVRKNRIVVTNVREGAEGDVRHFVESIVQEANAEVVQDASAADDGEITSDDRIAERFRAFAETGETAADDARAR